MRHAPKSGSIKVSGVSSGQLSDGRSMAEARSRSAGIGSGCGANPRPECAAARRAEAPQIWQKGGDESRTAAAFDVRQRWKKRSNGSAFKLILAWPSGSEAPHGQSELEISGNDAPSPPEDSQARKRYHPPTSCFGMRYRKIAAIRTLTDESTATLAIKFPFLRLQSSRCVNQTPLQVPLRKQEGGINPRHQRDGRGVGGRGDSRGALIYSPSFR